MASLQGGTLYDANKQLIEKYEKHLKGKALTNKMDRVVEPYLKEKIATENYFMLLCKEKGDYTIFHIIHTDVENNIESFKEWLRKCFASRGAVYAIDRTEDEIALEIWIKCPIDEEKSDMACYYLFPYSQAVIDI